MAKTKGPDHRQQLDITISQLRRLPQSRTEGSLAHRRLEATRRLVAAVDNDAPLSTKDRAVIVDWVSALAMVLERVRLETRHAVVRRHDALKWALDEVGQPEDADR